MKKVTKTVDVMISEGKHSTPKHLHTVLSSFRRTSGIAAFSTEVTAHNIPGLPTPSYTNAIIWRSLKPPRPTPSPALGAFTCNICLKFGNANNGVWHCIECQYDAHGACFMRKKVQDPDLFSPSPCHCCSGLSMPPSLFPFNPQPPSSKLRSHVSYSRCGAVFILDQICCGTKCWIAIRDTGLVMKY